MSRKVSKEEQLLNALSYSGNSFALDDSGRVVERGYEVEGEDISHLEAITKFNEKVNRLNAIASVYERSNRIVTGQEITVTVLDDAEFDSNARTDGRNIELNAKLIRELTDESIVGLHGVNYHELAHILFSPRAGSDLVIYARDNKMGKALKILEEGRAEQLLITMYPSTRPYLEANIYLNLLDLSPVRDWGKYFHLITGRTYLPLELRQTILENALTHFPQDIVLEVHKIIHAYRQLAFPRDFDKAKQLLADLTAIIGTEEELQPTCTLPSPRGGHGNGCSPMSKGRPSGKSTQESLQGSKSTDRTENITSAVESKQKNADSGAGTGSSGDTDHTVKSDTSENESETATAKYLDELMDKVTNNQDVRNKITDTRRAIMDSDEVRASIAPCKYATTVPSQPAIATASRFAQELERLVRDSDPAWRDRTPRGRLNISRTMNPDVNAIGQMFDEWDIGNEATDIEAVILTDNSGSMHGLMQQVCEATWIMKRGIESINGAVTVFNFEYETELLYSKEDKAKPRTIRFVGAGGGTNPLRGLIEADRILSASKKSIKLLFIVTDGDWSCTSACNDLIKSMNQKGFLTSVVFISDMKQYHDLLGKASSGDESAKNYVAGLRHNAQVFSAVATVREMLKVATHLVKSTIKRA